MNKARPKSRFYFGHIEYRQLYALKQYYRRFLLTDPLIELSSIDSTTLYQVPTFRELVIAITRVRVPVWS
jgi:hypothetical protein